MFIHNFNPVALAIGPLEVRWYGIVYALGFLAGYYILKKAAKTGKIKNVTPRLAEDYIFWLMIGGVLAGRLGEVLFFNLSYYIQNPAEIPAVWHGGMSFHGGLIGAILVTMWFCKKHKISFYSIADTLVAPLALTLVFGRITNFINAELWGTITDPTRIPWCVVFPGVSGCRHPSQLYEALYNVIIFIILLLIAKRKTAPGTRFWVFIGGYGVFRFVANFWREPDYGVTLLGLQMGQWLSLAMVIAAVIWAVQASLKASK